MVDAIHHDQLREHGGLPGIRDENLLESALARAATEVALRAAHRSPTLAAAYAFGLVTNHPYRDGNKRIGFLAMVTFLGVNAHEFAAPEPKSSPSSWLSPMAGFQKMPSPVGSGNEVPAAGKLAA